MASGFFQDRIHYDNIAHANFRAIADQVAFDVSVRVDLCFETEEERPIIRLDSTMVALPREAQEIGLRIIMSLLPVFRTRGRSLGREVPSPLRET